MLLSGDKNQLLLVAVEAYSGVAASLGHGLEDELLLLRVEEGIDFALGLCTEVVGVAHTVVALGTCCCLAAGVIGELFLLHR